MAKTHGASEKDLAELDIRPEHAACRTWRHAFSITPEVTDYDIGAQLVELTSVCRRCGTKSVRVENVRTGKVLKRKMIYPTTVDGEHLYQRPKGSGYLNKDDLAVVRSFNLGQLVAGHQRRRTERGR